MLLLVYKLSFTKYAPQTFEVTIFQIIVKDWKLYFSHRKLRAVISLPCFTARPQ